MAKVTFAATQMACGDDRAANVARAEEQVRAAAAQGAQIILLQELFETPYFCKDLDSKYFDFAHDANSSALLQKFSALAKELNVVLPISFFERANNSFFNSIGIVDADGEMLGLYRKSHIPDSPGYQEKFYTPVSKSGKQNTRTSV
jgi:N-carbamoylputrescine amidase